MSVLPSSYLMVIVVIVLFQLLDLSLGDGVVCQEESSLDLLPRLSNNLGYDTLNYAIDTYTQIGVHEYDNNMKNLTMTDAFVIYYYKVNIEVKVNTLSIIAF